MLEFEEPKKESTELIITDKILDKMNEYGMKLGYALNDKLEYRPKQQLLTIMSMINVLEEEYNVHIPIEISETLLKEKGSR